MQQEESKAKNKRFFFKNWMGGLTLFIAVLIFLAIKAPVFFTPMNLVRNWLIPAGIAGLIAYGMTIVMAGGGIDLSVGVSAGLCALVSATVATELNIGIAGLIIIAILSGILLGALKGYLVAYLGINPFVVTLSMLFLIRGLQFFVTLTAVNGTYIMLGRDVTVFGNNAVAHLAFFGGSSLLLYIFMDHSKPGRYIKAVGENIEVARYSGIPYRYYTWITYLIGGAMAALGGFMLTSYEGVIRVGSGEGFLIDAFLLPILGQAVFGRVSVQGTLFGSLFMYMLINGLFILGTTPENVDFIKGGLLLVMLIASSLQRLRVE